MLVIFQLKFHIYIISARFRQYWTITFVTPEQGVFTINIRRKINIMNMLFIILIKRLYAKTKVTLYTMRGFTDLQLEIII